LLFYVLGQQKYYLYKKDNKYCDGYVGQLIPSILVGVSEPADNLYAPVSVA